MNNSKCAFLVGQGKNLFVVFVLRWIM